MTEKKVFKNHIGELCAAIVLGVLELLALSLYYRDSILFWKESAGNMLLFAGLWLLLSAVFFCALRLLQLLFRPEVVMGSGEKKDTSFPERHPFLFSLLLLSLFYLPWIICFYPGSAIYDMMYQTVQADGFLAINAHHPIFSTWIIGLCSRLGLSLTGKLNLGIFFYILLQSAVCVLAFSWSLSYMAKRNVSPVFRLAVLLFFAVPPLWGGAMQCGTKDTLFTGLFVLFIVLSSQILFGEKISPLKWTAYGALILLLCLNRNAILVILVPSLFLFFLAIRKEKGLWKGFLVSALISLAAAAAFGLVTKAAYHTKTESSEILSLPFQQTARYVRDHGEEMTEEEQALVEKVFGLEDYRKLGELYYPMSSDPVKARFLWWASDQEGEVLKEYVQGWASMLRKAPGTYLEAALSQTYGYYTITPMIQNQKGGAGTTVQFGPDRLAVQNVVEASEGALSEDLIPESPTRLAKAQQVLEGWYRLWQKIPVLDLFFKCGFYFLVMLAITMYYSKKRNRQILLTVPGWLLILMAIASPVNEHIRYILPVAAALPFYIGMAAAEEQRKTITDIKGDAI